MKKAFIAVVIPGTLEIALIAVFYVCSLRSRADGGKRKMAEVNVDRRHLTITPTGQC